MCEVYRFRADLRWLRVRFTFRVATHRFSFEPLVCSTLCGKCFSAIARVILVQYDAVSPASTTTTWHRCTDVLSCDFSAAAARHLHSWLFPFTPSHMPHPIEAIILGLVTLRVVLGGTEPKLTTRTSSTFFRIGCFALFVQTSVFVSFNHFLLHRSHFGDVLIFLNALSANTSLAFGDYPSIDVQMMWVVYCTVLNKVTLIIFLQGYVQRVAVLWLNFSWASKFQV